MDISEDVFHPRDDHDIVEDPEIRRNNFRAGREADLQEKRTETFSPPRGDFEKRTPRAPRMNDLATQVKTGDVLKRSFKPKLPWRPGNSLASLQEFLASCMKRSSSNLHIPSLLIWLRIQ